MSRLRKYRAGRRVKDVPEAVRLILKGEYLMVCERPVHPGWLISQQVSTLRGSVMRGHVRLAKITKEWKDAYQ